jgi:ankyrin repeat protein
MASSFPLPAPTSSSHSYHSDDRQPQIAVLCAAVRDGNTGKVLSLLQCGDDSHTEQIQTVSEGTVAAAVATESDSHMCTDRLIVTTPVSSSVCVSNYDSRLNGPIDNDNDNDGGSDNDSDSDSDSESQAQHSLSDSHNTQLLHQNILITKADIDGIDCFSGFSAIMYAAQLGHSEIMKVFLQDVRVDTKSIDRTDRNGISILEYAAINGHYEIVEMLLSDPRVGDASMTLLHSDQTLHDDIAQYRRISTGPGIDHWRPIENALRHGHVHLIPLFLQAHQLFARIGVAAEDVSRFLLQWATEEDNTDAMVTTLEYLQEIGVPSHATSNRDDAKAACAADVESFQENAKAKAVNTVFDDNGLTPLTMAIVSSSRSRVEHLLCELGADVNAYDGNGNTPLMAAASSPWKRTDILEYLVEQHYANLELCRPQPDGSTALMVAVQHNQLEMVQTLLWYGALCCTTESASGKTALSIALDYRYFAIAKELVHAGADLFHMSVFRYTQDVDAYSATPTSITDTNHDDTKEIQTAAMLAKSKHRVLLEQQQQREQHEFYTLVRRARNIARVATVFPCRDGSWFDDLQEHWLSPASESPSPLSAMQSSLFEWSLPVASILPWL